MKFLATTITLSGLAAALPQASLMVDGPCAEVNNVCTEKDMLENDLVKGNDISCYLYQGEEEDDYILCQVNQGKKGIDQASEICNKLGGCINCAWDFSERIEKRIGGRVADFVCNTKPEAKNTAAARQVFLEQINRIANEVCESKGQDKRTCEHYKFDCINELSKNGPIIPDEMERCIVRKLE